MRYAEPNRLRELRVERFMTQAQLARRARVSRRRIQEVESGLSCRMSTKYKLLRALGMGLERVHEIWPVLLHRYASHRTD